MWLNGMTFFDVQKSFSNESHQECLPASWCLSDDEDEDEATKQKQTKEMAVVPYDPIIAPASQTSDPASAWVEFNNIQKRKALTRHPDIHVIFLLLFEIC